MPCFRGYFEPGLFSDTQSLCTSFDKNNQLCNLVQSKSVFSRTARKLIGEFFLSPTEQQHMITIDSIYLRKLPFLISASRLIGKYYHMVAANQVGKSFPFLHS